MGAAFCSLKNRLVALLLHRPAITGKLPPPSKRTSIMRRLIFLTTALVWLGGCSYFDQGGDWTKPGVDPDQARTDLDSCEAEARAQTKVDRGIDQDISATQGGGVFGDPLADSGMSGYQSEKRYDDVVKECMQAFGYVRQ